MEKLLKVEEVAYILNVSTDRVYSLARENLIPSVRIGRQIRVDESQLRNWIQDGGQALNGGWKKES